jgi:PAS domain S-box-containing protein
MSIIAINIQVSLNMVAPLKDMTTNNSPDSELLQKKIDALLDLEEDLILILDEGGLIKNVNLNGALTLDYRKEDIINRHILDIVTSKCNVEIANAFKGLIDGVPETAFDASFISNYGKEILFGINAKSIYNNSRISEIVMTGKNITHLREITEEIERLGIKLVEANRLISIERQRANQRRSILEELNRLKNEFVSNISHELRTPLASIIGFSETIASDPDMPDEMKNEFNNTILSEGKRLARLINDVLDISKLEGGKLDIIKFRFDAVSMLNEIIEAQKKSAETKNITLSGELPDEEILIDADKDRISQAISRLLNNAIKFTNPKGRIKIIAKNLFKEMEIIISDTGIGIPERDLPFIFQKFYRVNRPGTEIPGTGLGLVFVKQIIDLHKGFITIQSEVGKGTTFAIKLPKNHI